MTVAELIAHLQTLPQDARVMTNGYEGGLYDAVPGKPIDVALNCNDEWYYGPHELYEADHWNGKQRVKAIVL